jgi:hypothetical protein
MVFGVVLAGVGFIPLGIIAGLVSGYCLASLILVGLFCAGLFVRIGVRRDR